MYCDQGCCTCLEAHLKTLNDHMVFIKKLKIPKAI
jgi:hypothetical protein